MPEVEKLIKLLGAAENDGENAVNVFFSSDFSGRPKQVMKLTVKLSDFSQKYPEFQKACALVKSSP